MATVLQLPEVDESSIERLPAELLELILLETVADTKPPVWHNSQFRKLFCWREQCERGRPTSSQILQIRLVCRNFRDAAWRAFSRVLGETLLDISSSDSLDNLHAVANHPDLTPWIQKLSLTCNILYREHGNTSTIHPDALYEMYSVQERQQEWFPDAYSAVNKVLSGTASPLTIVGSIVPIYGAKMRKTLKGLTRIDEVVYVWNPELLPQRYMKAWLLDSSVYSLASIPGPEALGAQFGLTVTIQALANAGIQPKSLDLAVGLVPPNRIMLHAASRSMAHVCEKVESLALRDMHYLNSTYRRPFPLGPMVDITKTAFPVLWSLIIDYSDPEPRDTSVAPALESALELRDLTIIHHTTHAGYMKEILRHYGRHLHSLSLINSHAQSPDYLTETITHLDLEVLHSSKHQPISAENHQEGMLTEAQRHSASALLLPDLIRGYNSGFESHPDIQVIEVRIGTIDHGHGAYPNTAMR